MSAIQKTANDRWGIVNGDRLYVGQHLTRRKAIAAHVSAIWSGRDGFGQISRFVISDRLNSDQDLAWQLCRKNGDRAVRLEISWWEE